MLVQQSLKLLGAVCSMQLLSALSLIMSLQLTPPSILLRLSPGTLMLQQLKPSEQHLWLLSKVKVLQQHNLAWHTWYATPCTHARCLQIIFVDAQTKAMCVLLPGFGDCASLQCEGVSGIASLRVALSGLSKNTLCCKHLTVSNQVMHLAKFYASHLYEHCTRCSQQLCSHLHTDPMMLPTPLDPLPLSTESTGMVEFAAMQLCQYGFLLLVCLWTSLFGLSGMPDGMHPAFGVLCCYV